MSLIIVCMIKALSALVVRLVQELSNLVKTQGPDAGGGRASQKECGLHATVVKG